ncbi:type 1 glutamine amidotransferase [Litchfieldella qijiaojingensis]|uniref:type 1 glutamine amidotransferase n=1 Tax=Litchfieldella qijiaojingensis TaxID=980347 RepID=UPI00167416FA|nr:type 1 glutamine amidotransferase [Halomonas qijiaojingensis]
MKICIFENGLVPDDLKPVHGSYPEMIMRWLSPSLPEAIFHSCSPVLGEPLPFPDTYDGYILSGSRHSSYDELLWMQPMRALLRQVKDINRPIFGICFGHQIMVDAFGGLTQKAKNGWGVGVQKYYSSLSSECFSTGAFVFHQDQVAILPPEAKVIGGSEHCPNGIIQYDFPALSVQFHPEFSREYVRELAVRYSGSTIPEVTCRSAINSLDEISVDSSPLAAYVTDFFRRWTEPSQVFRHSEGIFPATSTSVGRN